MTVDRNRTAGRRLLLGIVLTLMAAALVQFALDLIRRDQMFVSLRWSGVFLLGAGAVIIFAVIFGLAWSPRWQNLEEGIQKIAGRLEKLGALNLLIFVLLAGLYAYLLLSPWGLYTRKLIIRAGMLAPFALIGSIFLKAYWPGRTWSICLLASALLLGVIYRVAAFIPDISSHPFTLAWSEASRYYYASLFFAERIYGLDVPPTALHPSRYLMQAVPFLFSGQPLWFHRLWQVLLWLLLTWLTVHLLKRRILRNPESGQQLPGTAPSAMASYLFLFLAWSFLFLFQGPVYYNLLVIPAILYWGFSSRKFWRSLLLVILTSLWAGISRINWFPMPGLIAVTLYLLEIDVPKQENRSVIQVYVAYLVKPVAWLVVGTACALLAQEIFVRGAGIEQVSYATSLTSDLLWYRLLPNPTFRMGILPAALLVSAPLLWMISRGLRGIHHLRNIGIGVILLVLFVGGVVVSTKIGGGSNLHNLDAFLVVLLTVGSYAWFGRVAGAQELDNHELQGKIAWLMVALILVPVLFAIDGGSYRKLPDPQSTQDTLDTIRKWVARAAENGGEVLFISERQLLTFDLLEGVSLVPEYEKVDFMEMAMGGNWDYLNRYYQDLEAHRFALIITDPMSNVRKVGIRGRSYPFGEENDVWLKRVIRPTLDQYKQKELFREFGIEVLEPIS